MRRFLISLGFIMLFVIGSVVFEQWYMYRFAKGMNEGLDDIMEAKQYVKQTEAMGALNDFYEKNHPVISHLVFSNRLEEIETVLHKLNAYVAAEDENEVPATIEELRSRINLLASTELYRRNHPHGFCID